MCFELSSCFCLTLNTGTKVIGFSFTVISALTAILYGTPAILMEGMSVYKRTFYAFMAIIASVQFFAAILLICGAFRKKPNWMWAWIVVAMVHSYSFIIYSLLWTIELRLGNLEDNRHFNTTLSVCFVYALFVQFCVLVVNSRRRELTKLDDPLLADVIINGTQSSSHLLFGGRCNSVDYIISL